MLLKNLLKNVEILEIVGNPEIEIKEVTMKSSEIVFGSLFICIVGQNVDGHNFIHDAEKFGAVAVVTERKLQTNLTQVVVKNTHVAISIIASNFYYNSDKDLQIIGITGTNGKTTTSHLIKRILDNTKIKCGVIGTLGVYYNNVFIETDLTTPNPLDLHKYLYLMREEGVKVVVMEVSAHALFLKRVEGINFAIGIFTNLTQDHLDYFQDMETYKKAKLSFFENNKCRYIVANSDDKVGREILSKYKNTVSYGIDNPADIFAIDIRNEKEKSFFVANLFDKIYEISTDLIGKFNIYNILASAVASSLVGAPLETVVESICSSKFVEGRLEKIYDKDIKVFIDYAHTPDGLKQSLTSLKEICSKKLICVFGCGGNRDTSKREIMGKISGTFADFSIITSDNPRYEDPFDIMLMVEKGIKEITKNYVLIENRFEAIKYAYEKAKTGDYILIAGKGAEKYQDVLGVKHFFNDKDTFYKIIGEKDT